MERSSIRQQWEVAMQRLDALSPRVAGGVGLFVFLALGLVIQRLPPGGIGLGLAGLLALLTWLGLSGKPVVKWSVQAATAPAPLAELLDMIELSGGEFWMGSPESETGRFSNEPRHRVRVSAFAMAKLPISQGLYEQVMNTNPSFFQGGKVPKDERADRLPVERVRWFDAVRFCNRLSEQVGLRPCYQIDGAAQSDGGMPRVTWDQAADGYRLPTEAEWEYACRAGTETAYSFGDDAAQLGEYAWYNGNAEGRTHEVGTKKPNGFGLYDLHGNVWEWCWDRYQDDKVTSNNDKAEPDPVGSLSGDARVVRGGAFNNVPRVLRSASRFRNLSMDQDWYLGFRCVRGSRRQH